VDLGLDEVEANLRTCPACRSFDKVQLANTTCNQVRRRSLGYATRRLHPPYSHVVVKVSARKRNSSGAKTGPSGARTSQLQAGNQLALQSTCSRLCLPKRHGGEGVGGWLNLTLSARCISHKGKPLWYTTKSQSVLLVVNVNFRKSITEMLVGRIGCRL